MTHIVVSLIGGQAFPIYAHIAHTKPDAILLIHSSQTQRQAQSIKQLINRKQSSAQCILYEMDTQNLVDVDAGFKALAEQFCAKFDTVTVNISGGTKPWSIIAMKHFTSFPNAKCIYIDQNNEVHNMTTFEHFPCDISSITINDIFALNNSRMRDSTPLNTYKPQDDKAASALHEIWKNRKIRPIFRELLNDYRGESAFKNTYKASSVEVNRDTVVFSFKPKGGQIINKTITAPNLKLLLTGTGWFELLVARALSKWSLARQIYLNVTMEHISGSDEQLNEFDIVVETNNYKLLFVECKTNIHAPTDIQKFDRAVQEYSGKGTKQIFVTAFRPETGSLPAQQFDLIRMLNFTLGELSNPTHQAFNQLDKYMQTFNA